MSAINALSIGIPSAIAALGAWLVSRSAAKASIINNQTTSRSDLETEAYERARKYDTETIARQDSEIAEVREQNVHLNNDVVLLAGENTELREEVARLRRRLVRLERGEPPSTEPIRERATDTHPYNHLHMRGLIDGE